MAIRHFRRNSTQFIQLAAQPAVWRYNKPNKHEMAEKSGPVRPGFFVLCTELHSDGKEMKTYEND